MSRHNTTLDSLIRCALPNDGSSDQLPDARRRAIFGRAVLAVGIDRSAQRIQKPVAAAVSSCAGSGWAERGCTAPLIMLTYQCDCAACVFACGG